MAHGSRKGRGAGEGSNVEEGKRERGYLLFRSRIAYDCGIDGNLCSEKKEKGERG